MSSFNPDDPATWGLHDIVDRELCLERRMVDRPFGFIDRRFGQALGKLATPLQASMRALIRNEGTLDVLDVGPGSGNGLYTWGEAVRERVRRKQGFLVLRSLTLTGLDITDKYRGLSLNPKTRAAMQDGSIHHILGDAAEMTDVRDGSFDVTLACLSLPHAQDKGGDDVSTDWLNNMIRVTRPGGEIFLTITQSQNASDAPFMYRCDELEEQGVGWQINFKSGEETRPGDPNVYGRIVVPSLVEAHL